MTAERHPSLETWQRLQARLVHLGHLGEDLAEIVATSSGHQRVALPAHHRRSGRGDPHRGRLHHRDRAGRWCSLTLQGNDRDQQHNQAAPTTPPSPSRENRPPGEVTLPRQQRNDPRPCPPSAKRHSARRNPRPAGCGGAGGVALGDLLAKTGLSDHQRQHSTRGHGACAADDPTVVSDRCRRHQSGLAAWDGRGSGHPPRVGDPAGVPGRPSSAEHRPDSPPDRGVVLVPDRTTRTGCSGVAGAHRAWSGGPGAVAVCGVVTGGVGPADPAHGGWVGLAAGPAGGAWPIPNTPASSAKPATWTARAGPGPRSWPGARPRPGAASPR